MSVESARPAPSMKASSEPVKVQKAKQKPPKPVKPRRIPPAELPLLVDLSYSLPVILVLMVAFSIIGFSYGTGTNLVTTLSRAMVAIVVLGGFLAIIAYMISSTALAETKERLEKERKQKEKEEEEKKALEALKELEEQESGTTEIRA